MKKNKNTIFVQELIRLGVDSRNAYRMMNAKKAGSAPMALRKLLPELFELRDEVTRLKAVLKTQL